MTPISRRNMLRGLGVAMALPFLDAMVPGTVLNAAQAASAGVAAAGRRRPHAPWPSSSSPTASTSLTDPR